jgi:uncharacterized protein YfiM (DUF2279 family)
LRERQHDDSVISHKYFQNALLMAAGTCLIPKESISDRRYSVHLLEQIGLSKGCFDGRAAGKVVKFGRNLFMRPAVQDYCTASDLSCS